MSLAGFLIRPFSRVPLLIIAGRLYGQAGFGRYVFAVGLFEALSALARLGLKDTLFRFLAEEPEDPTNVLLDALAVAGGLALVVGGGVVLAAPWIGETFGPAELWRALADLAPLLPVFVVTDLLLAATRAQKTVGYEVAARSLVEPAVLTLGALFLGLRHLEGGLSTAYAGAQFCALAVAGFGVARRYNWRGPIRLGWRRMKRLAWISTPTGLADCVAVAFNAVGALTLGRTLGASAVGVFGMAMSLETGLSKVRQAFDLVLVPLVSQAMARKRPDATAELAAVGRWILSAQLPVFGVLFLAGDRVLELLGPGFGVGAVLLAFLAAAAVIDGVVNLAQVPLFIAKPKTNFAIALVALGLHAGLGLLLTAKIGLAGVGVSAGAAFAAGGLMRQWAMRRLTGGWLFDKGLLRPLLAGALALTNAYALLRSGPPTAAGQIAACGLFLVLYLALLLGLDGDLRRRAVSGLRARIMP